MSTTPTKISEPGSGAAAIGKSVVVKGQIYSREDLYVDGEVEGTIEVQEHRLMVRGTMHGNMEVGEKIDIRKDAKLVGDLKTSRIVIEDGAYFKGSIDIVRREAPRAAIPAKPKAAPAAPHPKPVRSAAPSTPGKL